MASCLLAANKASLLYCIRLLPTSLHAVALEAKHPEVASCNSLVLQGYGPPSAATCAPERALVLSAIRELTSLTHLSIDHYWLYEAEDNFEDILYVAFTSLPKLSSLSLCDGWTGSALHALHRALPSMTCLQQLRIDGSRNTSAGSDCFASVHDINTLAIGLGHSVPTLQALALHSCKPDCSQIDEICASLACLTALTSLCLFGCFRDHRAESASTCGHVAGPVAQLLRQLPLLQDLDLGSCLPRTGQLLGPVFDAIADLTDLKRLSHSSLPCPLGDNLPTDSDTHSNGRGPFAGTLMSRLAPMLFRLSGLLHLDLSNVDLSVLHMAVSVEDSITVSLTQLTALILDGVHVFHSSFWPALALNMSALVSLRQLSMAGVCMSGTDVHRQTFSRLAASVATCECMDSWNLRSCRLDPVSADILAGHLVAMTALSHLDLSDNRLLLREGESIVRSLSCMPQIRRLVFGSEVPECGRAAVRLGLEECHGPEWEKIVHCHFPEIRGQSAARSDLINRGFVERAYRRMFGEARVS